MRMYSIAPRVRQDGFCWNRVERTDCVGVNRHWKRKKSKMEAEND